MCTSAFQPRASHCTRHHPLGENHSSSWLLQMRNGRRQFLGKDLHPRSVPPVLILQGKGMAGKNCFSGKEKSAFIFFLPLECKVRPWKWKITFLLVTCFRLEVQVKKCLSAHPWCRGGKWEAHGALIPNLTQLSPHPLPLEVLRVRALQPVLSHLLEKWGNPCCYWPELINIE